MKSKIFMYLFIFSLLLIVFQYVNAKHILDSYEVDIKKEKAKRVVLKDSVKKLNADLSDLKFFDLQYDDAALNYFQDQGYNALELIPFIKNELLKLNDYEGDDHPIVPFVSITKEKMQIDNIRLINHKWLVANFSDGKNQGQMLLSYEILNGEELKFKLEKYFMYPIHQ